MRLCNKERGKKKVLSRLCSFGICASIAFSGAVMPFSAYAVDTPVAVEIPAEAIPINNDSRTISDDNTHYVVNLQSNTYVLEQDITCTVTVGEGVNATLYLNGHSITGEYLDDNDWATNAITNHGTLTVIGSGIDNGVIRGRNAVYNDGATATLNIQNCKLVGTVRQGIWNNGNATIDNCYIRTEAQNGIYNWGGTVEVSNSDVSGIWRAIQSFGGDITIHSGTYSCKGEDDNYIACPTIEIAEIQDEFEAPVSIETLTINGGTFNNENSNADAVTVRYNNVYINDGIFNGGVNLWRDDTVINKIQGGLFKYKPDGYTLSNLEMFVETDGYYKLMTVDPVVSYEGAQYADFHKTIWDQYRNGGIFTLLADVELDSCSLETEQDVTIDLNGHNLTLGGTYNSVLYGQLIVNTGGNLIIKNSSVGGKIIYTHGEGTGSAFRANGGTITLENIDIELANNPTPPTNASTGILSVANGGTINMDSGSVTTIAGTYPALSKDDKSTLNITGGRFNTSITDLLPDGYAQDADGNVISTTATHTLTVGPCYLKVLVDGITYTEPITCKPYQQVTLKYEGEDPFHLFSDWGDTAKTTASTLTFNISADTTITPNVAVIPTEEIQPIDNVYTVTKPQQLSYLSWLSYKNGESFEGKTIKLGENLDFSNTSYYPIGCRTRFKGTFDGNNKTISNLNMNTTGIAAVIGLTDSGAVIKDLTVKDSVFIPQLYRFEAIAPSNTYAGIVGDANNAIITNCNADNVSIEAWFAGCIAGHGVNVTIDNSSVKNSTITKAGKAGGVIGYVEGSKLSNIEVTGLNSDGGGALVGDITSGTNVFENIQVKNSQKSGTNEKLNLIRESNGTVKIGGEDTYVDVAAIETSKASGAIVDISGGTYTCPLETTVVENGYTQVTETTADGTITKVVAAASVEIVDHDKFVKDGKGNIRFIAKTKIYDNAVVSGYGMWIIPTSMFATSNPSNGALEYKGTAEITNGQTYSADLMNIPNPAETITAVPFIINNGTTVQGSAYTAAAQ